MFLAWITLNFTYLPFFLAKFTILDVFPLVIFQIAMNSHHVRKNMDGFPLVIFQIAMNNHHVRKNIEVHGL